jgi:hypothetical protein
MAEETDLITGRPLPYSDDEYIRQATERLLLDLGYERGQVEVDKERNLTWRGECLCVKADLLISLAGRPLLLITCRRGSLVTREKETVAAARLLCDPWVPLAAVCNGDDAELLDTASGQVLETGLVAIPGPQRLEQMAQSLPPHRLTPSEFEKAARVYHAFDFIQCPGKCTV